LWSTIVPLPAAISWRHFVFAQGMGATPLGGFAVSWSLVVEEWFYLTLGAVVLLAARLSPQKKTVLMACACVGAVSFGVRALSAFDPELGLSVVRTEMAFRLDSLLIGVALAAIKLWKPNLFRRWAVTPVLIAGAGAIVLWTFVSSAYSAPLEYSVLAKIFWYPLISVATAMVVPALTRLPVLGTKPTHQRVVSFVTWSSILSYSLYLVHMATMFAISHSSLPVTGYAVLMIPLSYAVAWLLYRGVELPFLEIRDKARAEDSDHVVRNEHSAGVQSAP
jgi:peptidoglycan/LPS O-acetylase OafA/YrhL